MNYSNLYNNIIEKARSKNRTRGNEYYENHHIFPNCFCKDDLEYLAKDKRNLVLLTAREHFVSHWLLSKIFTEGKEKFQMLNAFNKFIHNENKYQDREFRMTSRTFEKLKKDFGKEISKRQQGKDNPNYGNNWTNEQKDQHSTIVKEWWSNNRDQMRIKNNFINNNPMTYMDGHWKGKKRPGHSAKLKANIKNNKIWWMTPWGCFVSPSVASEYAKINISGAVISKRCRNKEKVITEMATRKSKTMSKNDVGKKFIDLGYDKRSTL